MIKNLGVCNVSFDGTSLGQTFGAVIFREEITSAPVECNEKGKIDDVLTGSNVTVEVPLTNLSLLELSKVLPHATYDAVNDNLIMKNPVGVSLADIAKVMILKPIVDNAVSTDADEWLTLYSAAPLPNLEVTFDKETQRVFTVTFQSYPNEAGEKWRIGSLAV